MRNSIIGIVIMLMALNGFASKDKKNEAKRTKSKKSVTRVFCCKEW